MEIMRLSMGRKAVCDECKVNVDFIIRVGQEPTKDSYTAYLCPSCIAKAYGMMIIAQAEAMPKGEK